MPKIVHLFDTINRKLKKIENENKNKNNALIDPQIQIQLQANNNVNTNTNDDKIDRIHEGLIELDAEIDSRIPSGKKDSDLRSDLTGKIDSLHNKFDKLLEGKPKSTSSSTSEFKTPLKKHLNQIHWIGLSTRPIRPV